MTHFIVVVLHVVCPPEQLQGMCLNVRRFIFCYIYKQDENAAQPEHQHQQLLTPSIAPRTHCFFALPDTVFKQLSSYISYLILPKDQFKCTRLRKQLAAMKICCCFQFSISSVAKRSWISGLAYTLRNACHACQSVENENK